MNLACAVLFKGTIEQYKEIVKNALTVCNEVHLMVTDFATQQLLSEAKWALCDSRVTIYFDEAVFIDGLFSYGETRNKLLSRMQGVTWVLMLDTDERIIASSDLLMSYLHLPNIAGIRLRIESLQRYPDDSLIPVAGFNTKIIRRGYGKYHLDVHEIFVPDKDYQIIDVPDPYIEHTGYEVSLLEMQTKALHRLRQLVKVYNRCDDKFKPHVQYHIDQSLFFLGDYNEKSTI